MEKNNKKISKLDKILIGITIKVLLIVLALAFVIPVLKNSTTAEANSTLLSSNYTSAGSMAVMEVSTGRLLNSKNMHEKRAPASTTKILTAICVIENIDDLDKLYKIPDACVGVEGSSIYLEKGEELSIRDLLYGLMLQSGNDAAESLAIITSGSKEEFATLMNATAVRIGATNSNFVTAHGLDAKDHYTTAHDLALISCYALRNKDFAEIVKTKQHETTWVGRDYKRKINNKNKLLNSYDGADGVKTGFTRKAGRTFVASSTRDGMQVVCAVLNCGPMFEDSARLMTEAHNTYKMQPLTAIGQKMTTIKVENGKNDSVALGADREVFYPLTDNEVSCLTPKFNVPVSVKAPLKVGSKVGEFEINLKNELIYTVDLVTIEEADSKNIVDRLKDIADRIAD